MATKTLIIGLKELRTNTEKVISAVGKGAHFTVVRRSKPIFSITPAEGAWETVIDFTKLKKDGISASAARAALKRDA